MNLSIDEYARERRIQLGQEIRERKKVYLDTNYWIELRNVKLGRQTNKIFHSTLELLKQGVSSKKLLCPISDEIFHEILQQSDPLTLQASVDLIDELSEGVALLSSEERMQFEILSFTYGATDKAGTMHSTCVFVWSKVAYILELVHPKLSSLTSEKGLELQKLFFEHMWSMSLSDIVKTMGMNNILEMPKNRDISDELNKGKTEHAHENNSFKQLLLSEIAGVMDLFYPLFEDAMSYLYEKETGNKPTQEEVSGSKSGEQLANIIYHAFKENKLGEYLPSLIIEATLHASVRQDTKRKFKKNDMPDFRHAKAALPYFDYFFTEHALKDLVSRKNTEFDKKYNCHVVSKPVEAMEAIKSAL